MKKVGITRCCRCLLAMGALGSAAWAQAPEQQAAYSDEDLLSELLAVVDEGTELATATRMNVDFVPGMVTVLEADQMAALGARTVLDALALVPGVLSARSLKGEPVLVVRSVPFPFNSGNVKVTVNSISMSRESSGLSSSVLHWPLEQVERIEMVRGPGSVLYGDFAFLGLINIVTRKDGSAIDLRAEDSGNVSVNGRWGLRATDPSQYLNVSVSANELAKSEEPGARGEEARYFAVLDAGYRGLTVNLQSLQRELNPVNAADGTERQTVLGLRQRWFDTERWSARSSLDVLDTDIDVPGTQFEEQTYELTTTFDWRPVPRHQLTAKLSYLNEQTGETSHRPNPMQMAVLTSGEDRVAYALALQDQFQWRPDLALIAGLRLDRREDLDEQILTPRLAMIWQIDESQIIKAQYTEGFRAPTFFELFSPANSTTLSAETIASSELSYIRRQPGQVLRLTGFHLRLEKMLFPIMGDFANRGRGESLGAELEFEQQLSSRLKGIFNASYSNAFTTRNPSGMESESPSAARWLGNLALSYRPSGRWLLSSHLNYIGARNARNRSLGEEFELSLAATLYNWLTPGLDLNLSLRNALQENEQTVFEGPMNVIVRGFDERVASLRLSYRFD